MNESHAMNDEETVAHLRKYVDYDSMNVPFSWPTDACGYDQHIKFVKHRNENWEEAYQSEKSFKDFVLDYADKLEKSK